MINNSNNSIPFPSISVVGSIAVGKSTLVSSLGAYYSVSMFREDSESNPILTGWYEEPEKWEFWVKLFFHSRRVIYHLMCENKGGIMDRSFYDTMIFAELGLFLTNNEDIKKQLNNLIEEWTLLKVLMKRPLIIFLNSSIDVQMQRQVLRSRQSESNLNLKVFEFLDSKYKQYFGKGGEFQADITINVDNLNSEEVFNEAIQFIDSHYMIEKQDLGKNKYF